MRNYESVIVIAISFMKAAGPIAVVATAAKIISTSARRGPADALPFVAAGGCDNIAAKITYLQSSRKAAVRCGPLISLANALDRSEL